MITVRKYCSTANTVDKYCHQLALLRLLSAANGIVKLCYCAARPYAFTASTAAAVFATAKNHDVAAPVAAAVKQPVLLSLLLMVWFVALIYYSYLQ
jgi:hypothetical protein